MYKILLLSSVLLGTSTISAMRRLQLKVEDIKAPLKTTVMQPVMMKKYSDETRSGQEPLTKDGKNTYGAWVMHIDRDGARVLKYVSGSNQGQIFAVDSRGKELNAEEAEKLYAQHAQHFPAIKAIKLK